MTERGRKIIIAWLFTGCALIFLMVIVGGITRLTGSGLSITQWKIVTGTFPPLNDEQWQQEFFHYQQSPQYRLINAHFTIDDFKSIYWWEYIHRLIGRIIGLVFIFPFILFVNKKWIDRKLLYKLLFIFFLGGLQGFLGWYMVASGLVNNPHVSHFRLAAHLFTAFLTFAYTFWVALDLIHLKDKSITPKTIKQNKAWRISTAILLVLTLQIIYGAFVAGLKAGHIYNTWPKMGDEWVAESVTFAFEKDGIQSLFNNLATVQFVHRSIAIVLFLMVAYLWVKSSANAWLLSKAQRSSINTALGVVAFQFLLGVFTLLFNVPIWLGVLHQAGAFVLLGAVVYQIHCLQSES